MTEAGESLFRMQVREFVTEIRASCVIPCDETRTRDTLRAWTRVMDRQGWLVPHWPSQWGGSDWPPRKRYLLNYELNRYRLPSVDLIGLDLVAPLIYSMGSEQQKSRYLHRMRSGEDVWCQGFSEPNAGSDLSMITTSAVRRGEHYVVSGRKIWITQAELANRMLALVRVRTSGVLQRGVSLLLIDLDSAGVEIRPITTLDGKPRINEVELKDVTVPAANLLGEEGKGWLYATPLLIRERIVAAAVSQTRADLDELKEILSDPRWSSRERSGRGRYMARLTEAEVDFMAVEATLMRALEFEDHDERKGALAALVKLEGTTLRQRVSELLVEALEERGVMSTDFAAGRNGDGWHCEAASADRIVSQFLFSRTATIAAGTSEIQKNVIANSLLE